MVLLAPRGVTLPDIPGSKVITFSDPLALYTELDAFFAYPGALSALMIIYHPDIEVFSVFSDYFTPINAAGGMVWNKDDKLLIIKRLGFWDLPKGKCEPGEKKTDAALREVSEETGLKNLSVVRFIRCTYHTYPLKNRRVLKTNYWYEMHCRGNEKPVPQTEEDITEVRWVGREQFPEILANTYASLKDLFE